jgi:ATP-dependent Clp protease ATP-binding subunit ClpA
VTARVNRTIQILCRRSKNNPLFVGDPGVGKTAIAEGLAKRIVEWRCAGSA